MDAAGRPVPGEGEVTWRKYAEELEEKLDRHEARDNLVRLLAYRLYRLEDGLGYYTNAADLTVSQRLIRLELGLVGLRDHVDNTLNGLASRESAPQTHCPCGPPAPKSGSDWHVLRGPN